MKSLGNGSGFSKSYTSAYFVNDNNLFIIDIGDTAYHRLQDMELKGYENIYLLITHTHFDHIGALPIFVQYLYYNFAIKLIIVAASKGVKRDLKQLLKIGDVEKHMYKIIKIEKLNKRFPIIAINTPHSNGYLKDKCFGYIFVENGVNIVYTGDTSSLKPFRKYIDNKTELYVDVSAHYGRVHIKLEDIIDELIKYANSGIKVYLMHLDDISFVREKIEEIKNIQVF